MNEMGQFHIMLVRAYELGREHGKRDAEYKHMQDVAIDQWCELRDDLKDEFKAMMEVEHAEDST